jgi:hypothetical protein
MVRKMLKLGLGTRIAGAALALVPIPVPAAACGNSTASAGPGATVPRAVSTSTTSSDPYAIPFPITAAYVQRVLDELEAINAQMATIVVQQRALVPPAARLLRSVSTADEFAKQNQILLDLLDKGLPGFRPSPGPVRDSVQKVVFANSSCIFVSASRDFSALLITVPPPHHFYFALRRALPQDDPTHINPTNWVEAFLGYNSDESQPLDTCAIQP